MASSEGLLQTRPSSRAQREVVFPASGHTAVLDPGLVCALLPAIVVRHAADPHAAVLRLPRSRARDLTGAWAGKIGAHKAHHRFGRWGTLRHLQLNLWRVGIKGSGIAVRVPLFSASSFLAPLGLVAD